MQVRLIIPLAVAFAAGIAAAPPAAKKQTAAVKNRPPLEAGAFYPLPLGAVKPAGWLRQQLQVQAHGLSGHLDEFWPDLENSGWLGKSGESWERGPYYMDGLVPLAYLLDNAELIEKANRWMDWMLDHQRPDGAIGPARNTDWWPNMIALKALTQFEEATGDARAIPVMERYFKYQAARLAGEPLRKWARYRWQDETLSVLWLYNRTGDAKLLDLARALRAGGYDWQAQFANFSYRGKMSKDQLADEQLSLQTHVVNNAMALKTSAVSWLLSGDPGDRAAAGRQLRALDEYHLLPNGVHSGDEHYAGRNPTQGTELCAVVESMFSLEEMTAILGDPALADRAEKIAFNALPGAFSGDMWAHQYDQQPNQALASVYPRAWVDNRADSNIFGLEPNFGCCTANFHQGWPKFAAHLWMATPDDGLAAIFYGPSEVRSVVGDGVSVRIVEETAYPFRDAIRLIVNPEKPAAFPLRLRIPAWAESAEIDVNGARLEGVRAGTFYPVQRTWRAGDRVNIRFPMPVRVSRWYHNSAAIERGPLVYSLRIGEQWRRIADKAPAADWEVYPTTPWNYALAIDVRRPESSVEVTENPIGDFPFTPKGAPVELRVKARRLPEWTLAEGSAGPLPQSPAASAQPLETVTLIPYGAAKLRITAFPLLK